MLVNSSDSSTRSGGVFSFRLPKLSGDVFCGVEDGVTAENRQIGSGRFHDSGCKRRSKERDDRKFRCMTAIVSGGLGMVERPVVGRYRYAGL